MNSYQILSFVDQFQTLLVGLVGFLGVIWTLRANSRMALEERREQTEAKRAVLRRILAAELRNYSRAMKKNLAADQPIDGSISVGRVRRLFSEQLAADLGLLDPDEIDIVVNALISLDGMEHFMENISAQSSNTRHILPAEAWDEFQMVNSTTAEALDFAVQALEMSDKT